MGGTGRDFLLLNRIWIRIKIVCEYLHVGVGQIFDHSQRFPVDPRIKRQMALIARRVHPRGTVKCCGQAWEYPFIGQTESPPKINETTRFDGQFPLIKHLNH